MKVETDAVLVVF